MTDNTFNVSQNDLITRAIRWFGAISILPGIALPFYQYFIHGGRDAASIMLHPAEHATAHVLVGFCFFLLLLGMIAIFITSAEKIGRMGLVSFTLSFLSLAFYGGLLIMDAFTNTVLAKYQPAIQEAWHSASMGFETLVSGLLGPALFTTPVVMVVLLLSCISFGIILIRSKSMPWYVGVLFMIGGLVLGTGPMLPYRVVSIGYGGIGLGVASAGYLIWSGRVSASRARGLGVVVSTKGTLGNLEVIQTGGVCA